MLIASSIVVASDAQVSADLAGECAVLHLDSEMYYALNAVGTRIWALLQQPVAVSAILEMLLDEYEVDRDRCEADLMSLLGELEAKDLITVTAG